MIARYEDFKLNKIVIIKIAELEWKLLPHPCYSLNLDPSDYYLFLNLKRWLAGGIEICVELDDILKNKNDFYQKCWEKNLNGTQILTQRLNRYK